MAENKLASPELASYNVSSLIFVFSMLSLGRILISDLIVANMFMRSLSGMILLYLATPCFTPNVFLHMIYYNYAATDILWVKLIISAWIASHMLRCILKYVASRPEGSCTCA